MAPPQSGDPGTTPMDVGNAHVGQLVERYVQALKTQGAIRSAAVERAFHTVERHRLVETFYTGPPDFTPIHHDPERPLPEHLERIYADTALGTRFVGGMPASSTSQPSLVAEMLERLELAPGMKVLEVGAGTGYNAALMAEITGDQRLVVTVDVLDDVVAQTRRLLARAGYPGIAVLLRDGVQGVPEQAPFDRIVATVGCSDLSPRWVEQLLEGGRMLVPLAHAGGHPLFLLHRQHGRLQGRVVSWTGFMPVRGPLHVDGLWPIGVVLPDAHEPIHQRDPWPGFGAEGSSLPWVGRSADEVDLLFYLSLRDRLACWAPGGVGLSEDRNGWAVAGPDAIRWWKDASLVEQLDRLRSQWLASGRPTLGDYRVAFVPIGEDRALPSGGWALDRRFFRELVWLEPSGTSPADDHPAAGSVAMDDAGDDAGGGRRGRRAAPTAELAAVLGSRYGLHASRGADLGGSANLNLLVGDGPDRCVVRVYRPHVTTSRLAAIQQVRGVLRRAGVPCPALVPTRDGRPWVRVGGRLVEVERFVDHDAIMDAWERLLVGLPLLGRIHSVLQPIRVSAEGRRPRFANYLDPAQAVAATHKAAARIRGWGPTTAEARLVRLAEELAARVAAGEATLGTHALPRQLVHGDFWDNNVGFRRGRVVLVGDLDFMGERPRVDDLALTLHFAAATLGGPAGDDAGGGGRIAPLRRLVDAYDRGLEVPLSATERAALPWALARQPLWAVGGWLVWLDDERTARRLAAGLLGEVEAALRVVGAIDRWQQGFA